MKTTRCNLKLLKEYEKEVEPITQMQTFKIKIAEEKYKDENIYVTLLRPVVTCASETWTLTEKDEMRLCIFERQILSKNFGPIKIGKDIWIIRNNAELDQVINGADIVRFIKAQRVKWLGHLQRMDTSRIAKRIFEWKPIGRRSLGSSRLRWLDDVCDYLKVLKVRNWKELAMDRKVWNDLPEKAKTHKGL
jgi:hypothetical protein